MERKEPFAEQMARSLNRWRGEIMRLKSVAAKNGRKEFQAEIASLQARENAVREMVSSLKKADAKKGRRMKSGVEQAWKQLRQSLQDAFRHIPDRRRQAARGAKILNFESSLEEPRLKATKARRAQRPVKKKRKGGNPPV